MIDRDYVECSSGGGELGPKLYGFALNDIATPKGKQRGTVLCFPSAEARADYVEEASAALCDRMKGHWLGKALAVAYLFAEHGDNRATQRDGDKWVSDCLAAMNKVAPDFDVERVRGHIETVYSYFASRAFSPVPEVFSPQMSPNLQKLAEKERKRIRSLELCARALLDAYGQAVSTEAGVLDQQDIDKAYSHAIDAIVPGETDG